MKTISLNIIIEDREDYILQVRAAQAAIQGWREGTISDKRFFFASFEDGSLYVVRRNKSSVRVYKDKEIDQ